MKTSTFINFLCVPAYFLALSYCFAEETNERAVVETARQMGISMESVRREAIDGCGGPQQSMNICAQYHYVVEDLRLNDLYSSLQTRLAGSKAKELLKKSQRAWLTFRDATCDYDSQGVEGGTAHSMYVLACKQRLTEERSKHLEDYLSCTSNDCPGNDAE